MLKFGVSLPLSSEVGGVQQKYIYIYQKKKIMRSGVQGTFLISDVALASWLATLAC